MAQTLDVQVTKTIKFKKKEVTSFTPDLKNNIIYIAYDLEDDAGAVVGEDMIESEGIDFENVIKKASELAGVDIYTPLKQALYWEIERQSQEFGVVD